jgi:hypothetical protein
LLKPCEYPVLSKKGVKKENEWKGT